MNPAAPVTTTRTRAPYPKSPKTGRSGGRCLTDAGRRGNRRARSGDRASTAFRRAASPTGRNRVRRHPPEATRRLPGASTFWEAPLPKRLALLVAALATVLSAAGCGAGTPTAAPTSEPVAESSIPSTEPPAESPTPTESTPTATPAPTRVRPAPTRTRTRPTPKPSRPRARPRTPKKVKPAYPAGATAVCRDGNISYSAHRRGTCSHHGGVARWLRSVPS
ncbi:DUF3761 domain-containing protein [Actinomadura xylanilytica]|uniref:DUF3761 domain-containing protein n=1 Tax=Thermomonosporaceae TaxID=2012 RepID=UPI003D80E696